MRSSPAHFDLLCRDRLGAMGWQRDRRDPAGFSHARLRRRLSLPFGTEGTNLEKNARYSGENREPLQLPGESALAELRQRVVRQKRNAALEELTEAVKQSLARRPEKAPSDFISGT
jgi:hypothetical protein